MLRYHFVQFPRATGTLPPCTTGSGAHADNALRQTHGPENTPRWRPAARRRPRATCRTCRTAPTGPARPRRPPRRTRPERRSRNAPRLHERLPNFTCIGCRRFDASGLQCLCAHKGAATFALRRLLHALACTWQCTWAWFPSHMRACPHLTCRPRCACVGQHRWPCPAAAKLCTTCTAPRPPWRQPPGVPAGRPSARILGRTPHRHPRCPAVAVTTFKTHASSLEHHKP